MNKLQELRATHNIRYLKNQIRIISNLRKWYKPWNYCFTKALIERRIKQYLNSLRFAVKLKRHALKGK